MKYNQLYTEEHLDYLREQYKVLSRVELTDSFNQKFGLSRSVTSITAVLKNKKIKSGRTGHYKKGHVPFLKGTKGISKPNSGSFQKGHKLNEQKPLLSERVNTYGYIEIKTEEPNIWELKHRYMYKQVHGSIPRGYSIIFLDQDKSNCKIDNLVMVSKSELLILNRKGLLDENRDISSTGIAIAKLLSAINLKNKGCEQNG